MSNILKKIRDKAIDITSDVISAPTRYRYSRQGKKAEAEAKILIQDRASGGNHIDPDPNNKAYRIRNMANEIRYQRSIKK